LGGGAIQHAVAIRGVAETNFLRRGKSNGQGIIIRSHLILYGGGTGQIRVGRLRAVGGGLRRKSVVATECFVLLRGVAVDWKI